MILSIWVYFHRQWKTVCCVFLVDATVLWCCGLPCCASLLADTSVTGHLPSLPLLFERAHQYFGWANSVVWTGNLGVTVFHRFFTDFCVFGCFFPVVWPLDPREYLLLFLLSRFCSNCVPSQLSSVTARIYLTRLLFSCACVFKFTCSSFVRLFSCTVVAFLPFFHSFPPSVLLCLVHFIFVKRKLMSQHKKALEKKVWEK